jgi:hypothetical protein
VALLPPLVILPALAFVISTLLGVVATVVAGILALPLLISIGAHADLLRARSRYGLTDAELQEFARLVPRLASRSEFASGRPTETKRAAKEAAARMLLDARRRQPNNQINPHRSVPEESDGDS